ncbi:MAG: hypothetical protein ACOX6V_03065 [Patescibacteria group bacterium]|jgi:hypothetical protein
MSKEIWQKIGDISRAALAGTIISAGSSGMPITPEVVAQALNPEKKITTHYYPDIFADVDNGIVVPEVPNSAIGEPNLQKSTPSEDEGVLPGDQSPPNPPVEDSPFISQIIASRNSSTVLSSASDQNPETPPSYHESAPIDYEKLLQAEYSMRLIYENNEKGHESRILHQEGLPEDIRMVIVCDGFTAEKIDEFYRYAREFIVKTSITQPFSRYRDNIKWTLIALPSMEEGASHPPYNPNCADDSRECNRNDFDSYRQGTLVNNRLGSSFAGGGDTVEHRMSADSELIEEELIPLLEVVSEADYHRNIKAMKTVILVYDLSPGGACVYEGVNVPGEKHAPISYAIASGCTSDLPAIAEHEAFHLLGKVADIYPYYEPIGEVTEIYSYSELRGCSDFPEKGLPPCAPNITDDPNSTKWEGPKYEIGDGYYRAVEYTWDCIMGENYRDPSSLVVEATLLELLKNKDLNLIYESTPNNEPIAVVPGTESEFFVTLPKTSDGPSLNVEWRVDGETVSVGNPAYNFTGLSGTHTLECIVTDPTEMVREDHPDRNLLTSRVVWTVTGANNESVEQMN